MSFFVLCDIRLKSLDRIITRSIVDEDDIRDIRMLCAERIDAGDTIIRPIPIQNNHHKSVICHLSII
jgi:hypothetical protein